MVGGIMQLTEAFERVYILNLPFKEDRRQRLSAHLDALGLVDWPGVKWQRAVCGDWCPPPAFWGAGNGAWGCLLSHAMILIDAIHDGLESYLVLEDDVCFVPQAADLLAEFMAAVPADWGQIYLGGQHLHKAPTLVAPGVVRPHNINRTHAFAARKPHFARILQHILHYPDYMKPKFTDAGLAIKLESNRWHVDHQLGRAHEAGHWPVYCPEWWIAGQEAGPSNISGKTNPRQWWFTWTLWDRLPLVLVPPETALPGDLLHFGNTLLSGSLTDKGVIDHAGDPLAFFGFLKLIADEALRLGRLPAVCLPDGLPVAYDFANWPGGIIGPEDVEEYRYA